MYELNRPTSSVYYGITLRDGTLPEANNMALHSCENPASVLANRRNLANQLGIPLHHFVLANQTHSNHYYEVKTSDKGRGVLETATAIPDTDALYTYEPSIVLGTFTADCVPLLLWSSKSTLIASVHSGWQGTVKELVPTLLEHLLCEKGEDASTLHIFIGPSLSEERFEVDVDVADRYKALGYADAFIRYKESTHKFHIDNGLVVREQCLRAGIPEENIIQSTVCTYTSEQGFSYRQNRQAGRHLGFIYRL